MVSTKNFLQGVNERFKTSCKTTPLKGNIQKNISFICSRYHFNAKSEIISEIGQGVTILWLLKIGNLGVLRDTGFCGRRRPGAKADVMSCWEGKFTAISKDNACKSLL